MKLSDIEMLIPKIIHQTVRNKNALPNVFLQNIMELKTLNSDWHHRLYDDDDITKFISENYGPNIITFTNQLITVLPELTFLGIY